MALIEQLIIHLVLIFTDVDSLNNFLRDPQTVAILVGSLVAASGAWLGVFLLLRQMSLTSDAISHTVLLGIVVAFFVMIAFGLEPSLSSPFLLFGAAGAGLLTVVLTEWVQRSGLLKGDAALGLVFPLLFGIAVILISRFADNVHIDSDAVMVGEIGVAWANTNSYCLEGCDDVVITPDSPQAEVGRQCTNCSRGGISPRDAEAIFEETCSNCGTFSAAEAWRLRLIPEPPVLVYFPKALSVMALITVLNLLFVLVFYKELKLAAFDEALAKALGFRPVLLTYVLMILVSLTAVGAFNAVGSVLVVAFFIIPAATAYLLTDRLAVMLVMSPVFGVLGAISGYDLARGYFFGLPVSGLLEWLDRTIGLGGYTVWNVSISASMVMMTFVLFVIVWVLSPRYGMISTLVNQYRRRQQFAEHLLMGHLYNHMGEPDESVELAVDTLHEHLSWERSRVQTTLARGRLRGLVQVENGIARLTERGKQEVAQFRTETLKHGWQNDAMALIASGD